MIDYDKLKIAHELVIKWNKHGGVKSYFGLDPYLKIVCTYAVIIWGNEEEPWWTSNLDELITKLTELTQPQPKYKIGNTVWYLDEANEIASFEITMGNLYAYRDDNMFFPTKTQLIEAKYNYWRDMLEDDGIKGCPYDPSGSPRCTPECQHETNGEMYARKGVSKCIKCGEFYR